MNSREVLAIIDPTKCKPTKCNKECKKVCPVESQGKKCIDIEDVAKISEALCLGAKCGICAKSTRGCPFGAITLVGIPSTVGGLIVHRFGENGFRLYKLPTLKMGSIMGIIGENGVGKSTVINILSGNLRPNFESKSKMQDLMVIKQFRGTEIQKYLDLLYKGKFKLSIKPQNIEAVARSVGDQTVLAYINQQLPSPSFKLDEKLMQYELIELLDTPLKSVSGGELQRILCFITAHKEADVYIFDEFSNYLDILKRLQIAHLINSLIDINKIVIVIEHDLAILDYLSDYVTIMFGQPSAYGMSSLPYATSVGINSYFEGYIKAENMRFRESSYDFKELSMTDTDIKCATASFSYDASLIKFDHFSLEINAGSFPSESSILVVVGENGTGKTTFLKYLKEKLSFIISYKPQYLDCTYFRNSDGSYPTVEEMFNDKIRTSYHNDMFRSDVVKPLLISRIADRHINELSGGELQRVWIVYTLGQNAQIYLLDEPSSGLDINMRIIATKVIKKFILHNAKIAFIVEHDLSMATSLAQELNSRVIVFQPQSSKTPTPVRSAICNSPDEFKMGINKFLESLNITIRTDPEHKRPRINKLNSTKDREQKKAGTFYS